MIHKQLFFQAIRASLFNGKLTNGQVAGMEAILDEAIAIGIPLNQLAYCLATAYHETGATMKPIEEWGKGKHRNYGLKLKMNGKAYSDTDNIFYGRGFVQLTWYENYEKAGQKLGKNFIANPGEVMEMHNAVRIMFLGMQEGWFTYHKLSDYFSDSNTDFIHARKIINGMDRADDIAGYANRFLAALKAAS